MSILKKVINILTTVMLVLFVVFVILLVGVRLVGVEPHIVLSGSMEPEIKTGSIVFVKKLTPEEKMNLEVGQTVTYVQNAGGTKITHKIYEVVGPAYMKNQRDELVLDANGEKIPAVDGSGNPIIMYTTYGINNGGTLDGEEGVGNLASSNVVGRALFSIPGLGYVANFVQTSHGRIICFGFCIALVVLSIFSGSDKDKKCKKDKPEESAEATENSEATENADAADTAEPADSTESTDSTNS